MASAPWRRFRPQLELLEDRTVLSSRTPVLIVPGVGGTTPLPDPLVAAAWLLQQGPNPSLLTYIDNFKLTIWGKTFNLTVYQPLINSLLQSGYVLNQNLFVATYDWRLPIAPYDGVLDTYLHAGVYNVPGLNNGTSYGLQATDITSGRFKFGVDYLGYWLQQASAAYFAANGKPLDKVNVVAHSMGGLVARAYVQSDAYGGIYDSTTGRRLPTIDNLVMIATPHEGAAETWNPYHNNWVGASLSDDLFLYGTTYILDAAYQAVQAGLAILDYQFRPLITSSSDPERFVRQYVAGFRDLLPTYPFLDGGTVNQDLDIRNDLALDLSGDNNPFIANRFAGLVGHTDAIFGTTLTTQTLEMTVVDDGSPATRGFVQPFSGPGRPTHLGERWFRSFDLAAFGDGTVPYPSQIYFFPLDPLQITVITNPPGPVDHDGIVSNPAVIARVRMILGVQTLFAVGAGPGVAPEVKVYNADGSLRADLLAFAGNFHGGVRVATADVTGDGVEDVIAAAGPGGAAEVVVFDGRTLQAVRRFFAWTPGSFSGGTFVAAADVDRDGCADVIVGAGNGGLPEVKVFSGRNGSLLRDFFAFALTFRGGVEVAAADVNRDGRPDLLVAAGAGGGPQVIAFDGGTLQPLASFFAFVPSFTGGVHLAAADLNGDGNQEVLAGAGGGGGPQVTVFDGLTGTALRSFFALTPGFSGGVRVSSADRNDDGRADVIAAAGPGGGPEMAVFDAATFGKLDDFFAFGPDFRAGIYVG